MPGYSTSATADDSALDVAARDEPRLTLVYLGDRLPDYAQSALGLAQRMSGLRISLLANARAINAKDLRGIDPIAIEDIYDPTAFESASRNVLFPATFRNGLWIKSLERFFVLEQYCQAIGLNDVLHAELDQLFFSVNHLLNNLRDDSRKGLFVPFHTMDRAVASIIYCNDISALSSLIDFSSGPQPFPSEMHLIANWARAYPELSFRLPTLVDIIRPDVSQESICEAVSPTELDGIVDAAQLGQWIGGVDPRNVPIRRHPQTKFVDDPDPQILSTSDLTSTCFILSEGGKELTCQMPDGRRIRLYSLHLHSKVHRWLEGDKSRLTYLLTSASSCNSIRIPGTRTSQLRHFSLTTLKKSVSEPDRVLSEIRSRANRILQRRPGSEPLLSGDTFRAFADHVYESRDTSLRAENIHTGDVVFCESDLVEDLDQEILVPSGKPVVLLLGNSDRNIFLQNPRIETSAYGSRAFCQNLLAPREGFEVLPIGLENAWRSRNGHPKLFHRDRHSHVTRRWRIMWTFSVHTNPRVRTDAFSALLKSNVSEHIGTVSPRHHSDALRKYGFVACPPGNGEDTHRVWEAMYLGAVPIVLRSWMTERFEQLGFPVWVVDSYDEIVALGPDDLQTKYKLMKPQFLGRELYAPYWFSRIREASRDVRSIAEST